MLAYKGFNQDLTCRDMQYNIGETYTLPEDETVLVRKSGYHFCSSILDVFKYYSPNFSRYCSVEVLDKPSWDTYKILGSTKRIKVLREYLIDDIFKYFTDFSKNKNTTNKPYSIKYSIRDKAKLSALNHNSIAVCTGEYSQVNSHNCECVSISTGDKNNVYSKGDYSISTNTGRMNLINCYNKYSISANTGNNSITQTESNNSISANTGNNTLCKSKGDFSISANTVSNAKSETTGLDSVAVSTAIDGVAISTNNNSVAVATNESKAYAAGINSIAVATDHASAVALDYPAIAISTGNYAACSGAIGSWLVLVEREDSTGTIIDIKSVKVDGINIKENTEYHLLNGTITEVINDNN